MGFVNQIEILKQFGGKDELIKLLLSGTLVMRNENEADLSEYLELDVPALRRKERYEDGWDMRIFSLGIKKVGKEKFAVSDKSLAHTIPIVHLFSAEDEKTATDYILKMIADYRS